MKAGRAPINLVATIMTMMMVLLISSGCNTTEKDLLGKWDLLSSCIGQRMQIAITENNLTITYYDGCQHVCPYVIEKSIIKFSFALPEGKKLCDPHTKQINGEKLEAKFSFIDKNELFILLNNEPFYFERIPN